METTVLIKDSLGRQWCAKEDGGRYSIIYISPDGTEKHLDDITKEEYETLLKNPMAVTNLPAYAIMGGTLDEVVVVGKRKRKLEKRWIVCIILAALAVVVVTISLIAKKWKK